MDAPIRAGGWVDHRDGRGWVLDDAPAPTAPTAAPPIAMAEPAPAATDPEPDRAACPDCGLLVRLRKDGQLRKHQCVDAGTVAADEAAHETTTEAPPDEAAETESEPN